MACGSPIFRIAALTALVFFTCTLACGSAPRTASKRTVDIGMLLPADATPAPVLLTDPSVKTIEDGNCELACENHLFEIEREHLCGVVPDSPSQQIAACLSRISSACNATCFYTLSGLAYTKYVVGTILYAPPGCGGCAKNNSTVTYASNSSVGTSEEASSTTDQTDSISSSISLTVKANLVSTGSGSGNSNGGSPNSTASFGASFGNDSSTAISYGSRDGRSFTAGSGMSLQVSGPTTAVNGNPVDGIDHDFDIIYILPKVAVGFVKGDHQLSYRFGTIGAVPVYTWVYAYELKDPAKMRPNVASDLQANGITPTDYADILSADELASGALASPASSQRYVLINSVDYEGTSAPCPLSTFQLQNTYLASAGTQSSYRKGSTSTDGFGVTFFGVGFNIADTETMALTETSLSTTTQQGSTTASNVVACASPQYTGPIHVYVYFDLLYSTFVFDFTPPPGAATLASGTVSAANGKPVAGQTVSISYNGRVYQTITTALGHFTITGMGSVNRAQSAVLSVGKTMQQIVPGDRVNMALPR